MTHTDDARVAEIARLIAGKVGYDFDSLYQGKSEWTADRGSRHDFNTPYKSDFIEAAEAIASLQDKRDAALRLALPLLERMRSKCQDAGSSACVIRCDTAIKAIRDVIGEDE